jgi:hypothetical protein
VDQKVAEENVVKQNAIMATLTASLNNQRLDLSRRVVQVGNRARALRDLEPKTQKAKRKLRGDTLSIDKFIVQDALEFIKISNEYLAHPGKYLSNTRLYNWFDVNVKAQKLAEEFLNAY